MLNKFARQTQKLTGFQQRMFSTPTPELIAQLKEMGITNKEVVYNPSVA